MIVFDDKYDKLIFDNQDKDYKPVVFDAKYPKLILDNQYKAVVFDDKYPALRFPEIDVPPQEFLAWDDLVNDLLAIDELDDNLIIN